MREVIRKAKESEKEAKALQECTFTPKKMPTHNKSRSKDQSLLEEKSSVYERNIMWEAERQNKLERVRVEREQKVEKCSFKPTTTPQRPVSTIEYPRELKESSFIQEGLASHYHRMGKSRSKSPTRPKSPANNNNINTSRSSVHRRLSGGSGRQLHIDERAEQRKSVEYKRHRLGEALKQKYLLRRVYQHDS